MSRLPPGSSGRMPFPPGARPPQQPYERVPGNPPPAGGPRGYNPAQGYNPPQGYPARPAPPSGYDSPPVQYEKPAGGQRDAGRPLKVIPLSKDSFPEQSANGLVAVSSSEFQARPDDSPLYLLVQHKQLKDPFQFVFNALPSPNCPPGCIAMSANHREWCGATMENHSYATNDVFAASYDPRSQGEGAPLGSVNFSIKFASKKQENRPEHIQFDEDEICEAFLAAFDKHVVALHQPFLLQLKGYPILAEVTSLNILSVDAAAGAKPQLRGILHSKANITFQAQSPMKMMTSRKRPKKTNINFRFEDVGIGGLDKEFATIFRRAFASRLFDPSMVQRLGIDHVKGMLLYGPPGTGKTLIARQIGKMLDARPPKVINGPEVLNKYVGQSEENIRKMFADAEKEYKEKGDQSELHIIIFDELDAVCKQRGSGSGGGTGVGDSVVNQLLSKLDGVDQLNNILLIGMTNRKDMIDDALLRPGRLEVHIEISLPDEYGRLQILKIHTDKQRQNGVLTPDVSLEELAALTKNFSGAELYGLVRAATSFAFSRHIDTKNGAKVREDARDMKVTRDDFILALGEVTPAFGVSEADLKRATRLGIIGYNRHVDANIEAMQLISKTVREDPDKFSTSVLFHGPQGSGKTALAAHIAMAADFPFVKMIRPGDLAGYKDDFAKKDHIHKAFADAWKSPASILILDDFERLIGWNAIGPRYSTTMLEILTTLIVTEPPEGHRLLVFATTSQASALRMLEVDRDFAKKVAVPAVADLQELGSVLAKAPFFDSEKVEPTLNRVKEITGGSDRVNVGIKPLLDNIFEARTSGEDVVEKFAELLANQVQSNV